MEEARGFDFYIINFRKEKRRWFSFFLVFFVLEEKEEIKITEGMQELVFVLLFV